MRRTRPIDYINRLLNSGVKKGVGAGEELLKSYKRWKRSLRVDEFMDFIDLIQVRWKDVIMSVLGGLPQMIGQFRAYSLEEYVYDLLTGKLGLNKGDFKTLWNEKIEVWRTTKEKKITYSTALDLAVLRRDKPIIALECKIDVDAPRLKAAMLNFMLLKMMDESIKTALIYVNWNADEILKRVAELSINSLYNFNKGRDDEVNRFLNDVSTWTH